MEGTEITLRLEQDQPDEYNSSPPHRSDFEVINGSDRQHLPQAFQSHTNSHAQLQVFEPGGFAMDGDLRVGIYVVGLLSASHVTHDKLSRARRNDHPVARLRITCLRRGQTDQTEP